MLKFTGAAVTRIYDVQSVKESMAAEQVQYIKEREHAGRTNIARNLYCTRKIDVRCKPIAACNILAAVATAKR